MPTMNLPAKIIVFYSRSLRLWIAHYSDDLGNQIGSAGYGPSKREAIEDAKYQARISGASATVDFRVL
jgi:hypothetical protein